MAADLHPADPLATTELAAATSSPVAEAAAANPAPPKRGGGLRIMLLVLLILVVVGIAGIGLIWMKSGNSGLTDPIATTALGTPVRPQPAAPSPPATFEVALLGGAESASPEATPLNDTLSRLPALAAKLAPSLHALPLDPSAPPQYIVPGGGHPSAGDNSKIPRHQRWQFDFPPGNTIESYTRQLDFFKIELGAIGGSDQVLYLASLSEPIPKKRIGPAADEKRLYLTWQRGSMREADELLAARAQVPLAGKLVAHFCPPELETLLAAIEDAHAAKAGYVKIRRTTFGIKPRGADAFEFYVLEQIPDES